MGCENEFQIFTGILLDTCMSMVVCGCVVYIFVCMYVCVELFSPSFTLALESWTWPYSSSCTHHNYSFCSPEYFSYPTIPTELQRIVSDGLGWEVFFLYLLFQDVFIHTSGFASAYFSVTDFNQINSHVSRLSSRRPLLLHCQICLFICELVDRREPGLEERSMKEWTQGKQKIV